MERGEEIEGGEVEEEREDREVLLILLSQSAKNSSHTDLLTGNIKHLN